MAYNGIQTSIQTDNTRSCSSPTQSFQSINMGLFGSPYLLLDITPVFATLFTVSKPNQLEGKSRYYPVKSRNYRDKSRYYRDKANRLNIYGTYKLY